MNEGLDGHRYNQDEESATPAGDSGMIPRPDAATRSARLQALWATYLRSGSNLLGGLSNHPVAAFLRRQPALRVVLWMLLIPVAAVILGYFIAPTQRIAKQAAALAANSSDRLARAMKPKPSPGKPLRSAMPAPAPNLAPLSSPRIARPQQLAATTPAPQRPLAASVGTPSPAPNPPPPAPAVVAKAPYTPLVYRARHDKHFGEACSGQLTLDSSALVFKCPDDPRHSVQVALNDIESVDSNGIRLTSGKKYHFSIPGMTKDSEEELFAKWLDRVR